MSFTPWFFSHNSHHHLIMRKHQAGPPPTPKPPAPAPTVFPMELLPQWERWETFQKQGDLRCEDAATFPWISWAQGTTPRAAIAGRFIGPGPPVPPGSQLQAALEEEARPLTWAPCSCWARQASAWIVAPGSCSRCRAQSFHASALRRCAPPPSPTLQNLGKALCYIGWWQSSMMVTEEHKALPSLGWAGTGHKGWQPA